MPGHTGADIFMERLRIFLRKARARGLAPSNVISWLSLEIMRIWGAFWGTLRFYAKARLFGVKAGKGITAHGPVGLMRWPGGAISVGSGVSLISSWRRATACALAFPVRLRVFGPGAEIVIGDESQLSGVSISARSTRVEIGRRVLIAPNCVITDSDFHAPWPAEERISAPGMAGDRPVRIGDYAWIGMNSIILKGGEIGEGAVIGAGSVVCGHIPPYCVAAGAPARVIRQAPGRGKNESES